MTRDLAAELGVGAADVIHPCRVAVTGQGVSPDIFSVIHLIGREKTVERLRKAVAARPPGIASAPDRGGATFPSGDRTRIGG